MARTQRRRAVAAPAGGEAAADGTRRVRENLPRPAATPATSGLARPEVRAKRNPFGFLSRLAPRRVMDIISELRKVTWPSFAETRYLTIVVAIVAVAMGIFLGALDLAFGWVVERIFF
jgi:preprotein translocase SecE subunit